MNAYKRGDLVDAWISVTQTSCVLAIVVHEKDEEGHYDEKGYYFDVLSANGLRRVYRESIRKVDR